MVTGLAAVVLLLAVLVAVEAQQAVRVYRIGFVSPLSRVPEPSQLHAFRQGLRELGYVDGKNVIIEARFAEGRNERLPELVAELLRMKVDVLLAGSTPGALAAKKATTTVPVVFAGVTDPISAGIVSSLARPGGNITGAAVGAGGVGFAEKWGGVAQGGGPRCFACRGPFEFGESLQCTVRAGNSAGRPDVECEA